MADLVEIGFVAHVGGIRNAERGLDNLAGAGGRADSAMSAATSTARLLGSVLAAIGVSAGTQELIQYSDQWKNVNSQLRQVTETEKELVKVRNELLGLSKATRTSLSDTVSLYSNITRATSDLGLAQGEVVGITKTINNLFVAGGKSGQAAAAGILQLSQAFAAGVLRGDEFNSVAENAPRIMDALVQYTGMGRGALRAFAAEGGITAEILTNALKQYESEAQRLADATEKTFGQSLIASKDNIMQFVGGAETLNEAINSLGSGFEYLTSNLDEVMSVAESLAIIIGGKVVASYGASAAAAINRITIAGLETAAYAEAAAMESASVAKKLEGALASTNAEKAMAAARANSLRGVYLQIEAEQQLLNQKLISANAEMALEKARYAAQINDQGRVLSLSRMRIAEAELSKATMALSNAGRDRANVLAQLNAAERLYAQTSAQAIAANTALASSSAAAATAAARQAASINALSLSARAGAVAVSAMSGALALIGGPAGAALIAAGGIYYLATRATESEKILESLGETVDSVSEKFKQLGVNQQALARQSYAEKIEEQKQKIASLSEQLENLNSAVARDPNGFFSERQLDLIIKVGAKIESAGSELERLNSIAGSVKMPKAEIDSFLNSLTNINSLLGIMPNSFSMVKESAWSMFGASAFGAERNSEAYTKILADIEKKIALHGNESAAAELAYDASIGAIKGLTDAEAAHLVARQKTLESMDAQAEKQKAVNDQLKAMQQIVADWDIEALSLEDDPFSENAKEIAELNKEFDEYIDSIDEFGGAWTRTGSAVVDAVGSIVDVFDDYESRLIAIGKAEEENARKKAETMDPGQLKKLYAVDVKLANQRTKAQLSGYASIAGAASKMFSEQSKERKALNNAEKAFTAVEIALSLKKAGANALSAITSAFAAPFPINFASGAAMIAIMAGLGVFGGGGGGGGPSAADIQESQGTGTVMGSDDKSSSIANSSERYLDVAFDQLVELRGIRENLAKFQGGIAQIGMGISTSGLADQKYFAFQNQSFNEAVNSGLYIGGSQKKHSEMRADLAPVQNDIKQVLGFMQDTITSGVQSLGLDFERSINDYWINIGKVSFKDMSGEEISQALSAILSKEADLLTAYLAPQIEQYQQMGEGLFETLTRVAQEQAVFNDAISAMGISMTDLSALMKIDVAQSVIGLIGGLEKFSEAASSYIDNFFTEDEKFGMLAKTISETFAALGQEVPATRDAFRDMIEAIDPADAAQQRLLASLLEMNPAVDEYLSAIEKQKEEELKIAETAAKDQQKIADAAAKYADTLAKNKYSLEIELLKAQGKTAEALLLEQMRTLDGLDESLRPLQQSIWDAVAANKTASQQYSMQIELLKAQGNEERAIYLEREKILAALDESLRPLQKEIWDTIAATNAQAEANAALADSMAQAEQAMRDADSAAYDSMIDGLNNQQQAINKSMSNAEALLRRSFAAERERLTAVDNERMAAIDLSAAAEIDAINSVQTAKMEAIAASNAAQMSGLEAMKSAASAMGSDLHSLASSLFSAADSFGAQMIDRGAAFASLSGALSAARSGDFSKALSLGGNVDALKSMSETDFSSATDFNIAQARAQYALTELAKLSSSQATVQDEIVLSLQAQIDVAKVYGQAQLDAQKQYGDALVASVNYQAESQKADTASQVDALDAMLDELLGVDNSVASLEDAITQFKQAQDAVAAFDYDAEVEKLDLARNQLGELQRINENLANQNIIAQQQNDLASEVVKLRETMTEMQKDANDKLAGIARSTSASAKSLQNQEFASEVA